MNTSVPLTDAAWLLVAYFQELFHSLTKPVGRRQILSISTPSLPLCLTGWEHIPGIIYCETYGSCCTVSDLIWPNDLFKPLPPAVAFCTPWISCACQDWLSNRLQADCLDYIAGWSLPLTCPFPHTGESGLCLTCLLPHRPVSCLSIEKYYHNSAVGLPPDELSRA